MVPRGLRESSLTERQSEENEGAMISISASCMWRYTMLTFNLKRRKSKLIHLPSVVHPVGYYPVSDLSNPQQLSALSQH